MDKMSHGASFLRLNGRSESSSFHADHLIGNEKYKSDPKNKVISTVFDDHISVTEPAEVTGNTFCVTNSFPTTNKCKFSGQENISCEFYEVKLGKQGFALRHKLLSEVSDGFTALDRAPSEASDGLPVLDRALSEASDGFTATDIALSEASDGLPALDKVQSEGSDGLPATDKALSEGSDGFTAIDETLSETSDGLPATDKMLSETSDDLTATEAQIFGAQDMLAGFPARTPTKEMTAAQVAA